MKRILFVDDEPHLLEGLQRMFRAQRKTWEMSFAKNGNEALALLAAAAFDVIVTDMRMPEMDGATLLQHVQEQHPSVARIVLSGHVEMEVVVRAAPVVHQFLSKPCDPEKLRVAIQRACNCRAKLNDEDIRRVIGAVGQLPSLPSTCASLLMALQEPDVNMARVWRIIEQDVGMTAKVLQLVNSAFFGLRNEMTDVRGAVNYLGLDTLKQLVLSVELLRTFQPSPAFAFWLAEFEAHCRLAAQIATRLPVPSSLGSTAVVAALLHDTGKLVIATRLPSQFELALRTAREERLPLHDVEDRLIGTNHAEVGAYLLDLWGLPEAIVEAARRHHHPKDPSKRAEKLDVVAVTHVADALARELKEDLPVETSSIVSLLDMDYVGELGMIDQLPIWRALARQVIGGDR
jgi:HD-like signal output (HDOD) protein/CheY-like chemotaxis protein